MSLQVKIKKLHEKAVIPKYMTDGAVGMDLVAISENPVFENGIAYIEYGTGLAIEIPKDHVCILAPRSSITSQTSLVMPGSIGIIDRDYRGELKFRFKSILMAGGKKYKVGDRIGQLLIVPAPKLELVEVQELSSTDRGSGGFGSTNK